ncbi:protein no-on-transient A-like [Calliphora vicina]|uniref:protein no-on-transient A-like n=1 Tax=Calliphora vicina TaxID=7373 RepID=UPI00325BF144
MEGAVKAEVNGSGPLPQRPQKNQGGGNKNFNKPQNEGGPAEKKPRFNQGGGGNNNQGNRGGFGNNRNNNNRNRGGNAGGGGNNRGNFQNQQQNQQQPQNNQQQAAAQQPASDAKPEVAAKTEANANVEVKNAPPNNQQPQQNQQNQNHNNMNKQGGGGMGGGDGGRGMGGGGGGNRDNRDRGQKRDRNFDGPRGGGGRDGPRGMGDGGNRGGPGRNDEFFINQRLRSISGPTHELPPIESTEETKFSGRNRLYVGNLTNDVSEEDLRELFKPYGEIGEVFSNPEKNFAFLKMDFHVNAERAKRELDGTLRKGRMLRVRYAPNATILRVSNLTPFVSNELLLKSFEVFGPVERACVTVDDRGKSTGEGVVEFAKKSSANVCLRFCSEKCFFLTASLRPCVVEPLEANEDTDGLPDKSLNKKLPEFNHERNVGPRFAEVGSFEHEYGTRWKQLHELFKTKQEALKRELKMEEEKLEAQMEYARYEHETELLRQELRKRESDNERKKMEWEMREKQAEELRKRDEEQMHRQQTEMQTRMLRQEEEMRRRQQENTLFMQAQQLNSLLDQQEGGFSGNCSNFDNFGGGNNSPFDFRGNNAGNSGNNGPNGPNNQQDFGFDFGGNQNQGGPDGGNQRGGNQRGGNNNNNNNNNGGGNNNPWERRRRF